MYHLDRQWSAQIFGQMLIWVCTDEITIGITGLCKAHCPY